MLNFHHYEEIAHNRGYYINKDGVLFNKEGRQMKPRYKNGYVCFRINGENKRRIDVRYSRLQAYQKYGSEIYDDGIVVRHLNNNKEDNSYENIAIGTMHDNMMDNPPEKRLEYAINASMKSRKYDQKFIDEIREKHEDGWSYNKIKEHFNLPKSTISYIINHKYVAI